MAKVICSLCGAEEDTERWIPSAAKSIQTFGICQKCLFWREQTTLDDTERGLHRWAVINGTHYVLNKHTDIAIFKGFGGNNFHIRFKDGFETECDNLWCQGDIPAGYWRNLLPDNAEFVNEESKTV